MNNLICNNGEISDLRPYEKCVEYGPEFLTDTELLATIIRSGTSGKSAVDLSKELLSMRNGNKLLSLIDASIDELKQIKGIGTAKAVQIKCICELSRRISKQSAFSNINFSSPESIAGYYMEDLRHLDKEHLILSMLDTKLKLIRDVTLSVGTVNGSLLSTREIFIEALKNRAVYIVLLHNHPSGDSTPSGCDIETTKKVCEAGRLLGIQLIDHIIIGDNNYTSLKEYGCVY
ncbi:MAG: DNA repair protein RadC [Eubacteriales bacterium]|nr:DNA repair protein RadC [Eubacteriales bacterium]